jgi:hypothetical protein
MKTTIRLFLSATAISCLLMFASPFCLELNAADSAAGQDPAEAPGSELEGIVLGAHIPPVDPSMGANRLYYWQEIQDFNQITGRFHPIIMYFGDLTSGFDSYLLRQLRDKLNPSPVPYISMDPYGVTLQSIINGSRDAQLRANAAAVKDFGKPVLIQFAHEFNGTYMPWYGDPAAYIAAWRHIHDLFAQQGVTNVQWVWTPNYKSDRPDLPKSDYNLYYPGDNYVDWISVDGFNWGVRGPGWVDFEYLFHDFLVDTACRYRKPQMIGQIGSANGPGSKADWIWNTYGALKQYPNLRSIVWFNDYAYGDPGDVDFRLTITSQYGDQPGPYSVYTAAYKQAISDPIFLTTMPAYNQLLPDSKICFSADFGADMRLVIPGMTAKVPISIERAPTFHDPITFSIPDAPRGISGSFDPSSLAPGETTVVLELDVSPQTAPGTYQLTIEAGEGGFQQSQELTVAVASKVYRIHLPVANNN